MKIYRDWTTDELLDELPSNLHLARNENAPEHDRWRVYNMATGKYPAPGYATARECLIGTLTTIAEQRKAWIGDE